VVIFNPTDYEVTFDIQGWEKEKDFELYVFDVSGKILRREAYNTNHFTFKKENLSTGIYFYQLKNKQQVISNGKLIIL
jgi:Secretion system C-terminal sorting domain